MKFLILILLFISISVGSYSQNYYKSKFIDAEYYFLFDEYSKALPLYLSVLEKDSLNANINYRIALCYLNLVGQKYRAIPFLEKAVKDVTSNYKEGSYKELRAPFEAYLFLGDAYRINEEVEKAIKAYEKFKSLLKPEDVYFKQIVDRQLISCQNALDAFFNPVEVDEINLGENINGSAYEYNPCITYDESLLFYDLSKNNELILSSKKLEDGTWEKPKNVTNLLKSDGFSKVVSISGDGKLLFLTDDFSETKGDIYVSQLNKGKPGPMEKLNKNVNSKFSETHACISLDGKTIYFTSDRKGGYGGLDIYKSEKSHGDWGPAVNLGPAINTPYNEETPFIAPDGRTLYFSSEGHNSIGGFDFFVSNMLNDGKWSAPLNLGYPISSTDDDLFYCPVDSGKYAYTYRVKNYGDALSDIYIIKPKYTSKPKDITFKGRIDFADNQTENISGVKILFVSESKGDTTTISPDFEKSTYYFLAPVDNYEIIFKANGYHEQESNFVVPQIRSRLELVLDIEFVPAVLANNADTINNADTTLIAENNVIKTQNVTNNLQNDSLKTTVTSRDTTQNTTVQNNNTQLTDNTKTNADSLKNVVVANNVETNVNNTENNSNNNQQLADNNNNNNNNNTNNNTVTEDNSKNITKTQNNDIYTIKSIYFDFASYSLNNESKSEIEKLYKLMDVNPGLTIELIGHTDSKGNPEYNKTLSERRAVSVLNYLASKGINKSRISQKGVGEDDNVAINENPDGTDNPMGRQLNRRVDINILNKANANVIVEGINVPDNLKFDSSTKFYILLTESPTMIQNEKLTKCKTKEISNASAFKNNAGYFYLAGEFSKKSDAVKLLNEAIDCGFDESKIINSFELTRLNGQPVTVKATEQTAENSNTQTVVNKSDLNTQSYTIQISSITKEVDVSIFKGVTDVKTYACKDGFYRYATGQFADYIEARNEKNRLIELGYNDAFIIKTAELMNKVGKFELQQKSQENTPINNTTDNTQSSSSILYTIQIKALNTPVGKDYFKGLDDVKEFFSDDGYIKYTMGEYSNYQLAMFDLNKVKEQGYTDAYIVDVKTLNPIKEKSFINNKKGVYTIQIKASKAQMDIKEFKRLGDVREYLGADGYYRYVYGIFDSYYDAKEEWEILTKEGYPDAFISPISKYKE